MIGATDDRIGYARVVPLEPLTIGQLVEKRMVRTHDAQGLSYNEGNRAERRSSMRYDNGDAHHPKQLHKQGHKLY